MGPTPASDPRRSEPPLWSIGLAVVIVLVAPIMLYSLAPTGPLREGDTIFSNGQQRVTIADPGAGYSRRDGTCLLDPDQPMIIVRWVADRPDDGILAQVQGNPANEWPFCPPHTQVLVTPPQLFQKPALGRGLPARLSDFIGGTGLGGR